MLNWRVPVDGDGTPAIFEPAIAGGAETVFVCAHGAGGHMRDSGLEALARVLREQGIGVVRFNFPYREQGTGRPDPMPRLAACMTAVVEHTRRTLRPRTLVIGGRSLGARTASLLAARGAATDGVLMYAYPLHPARKPETLRDAHLREIRIPVLCVNGTRDALCTRELMEPVVSACGDAWTMHWIEGADHSFNVLKSSGRTQAEVLHEIADVTSCWLAPLQQS